MNNCDDIKDELSSNNNEYLQETEVINNYYDKINIMIINSKNNIGRNINHEIVELYYNIGKTINELIETHHLEASQNKIIKDFSKKLTSKFGQGFGVSNLKAMKKFYLTYKTGHTVCDQEGSILWKQLSWSHNRIIMNVSDKKRRMFYLEECIKSNWSVRQLERQINSFYYERLISTGEAYKNDVKNEINKLENKKEDFIKDPYVLEFLDIKDKRFLEKDLESNLLEHIQDFLLELGRGFSFVSRQKRIDVDGDNFISIWCFIIII